MRKSIFWGTLVIAAVVLGVCGLIIAVTANIWYNDLMVKNLRMDTSVLANKLSDKEDFSVFARDASEVLSESGDNIRITVIDQDGNVLGDSSADYQSMENHANRPEVLSALQNGWGTSQRYSDTLGVNMLYVVVYNSDLGVFIRAAMPMYEVQDIYWGFGAFILLSLVISFAAAAFMAVRASKNLSKPIVALSTMTDEIAEGNYKVDPIDTKDPEFAKLSNGLINLSRNLDSHMSALQNSNTQLSTVLASISEGLIALDGRERVLFINDVACNMLELTSPSAATGYKAAEVISIRTALDMVKRCLNKKATFSSEITLPGRNQLVQVSASPMHEPAVGCILLIVDITHIRKLENIRRDFVANVTHELRTPLTSIKGYVEALKSGALERPELSKRFLQIIEIESERLSALIGDLLSLSEIENAEREQGKRFALVDVADSVVEMLEISAAKRDIGVACNVPGDIYIEANPDRIKQLLLNLADNAVKYNKEGGSVLISAEKSSGMVRISVKDTGIGISEEHISRIFERFYRVDKGRSRSMGGTGLGLSIVKHIVDLYQGNIRLISKEGQGSEFIIELPITQSL